MTPETMPQSHDSLQYGIRLQCWDRLFRLCVMLALVGTGGYVLLKSWPSNLWGFSAGVGLLAGAGFLGFFLHHYSQRKILITSTELIQTDPDKTIITSWENIHRIEEIWGWGNRTYYVRTPNGVISIPDTIERCDELLTVIQERSGKRIVSEWRGAKDSLREDWQAFLRWLRTHPMELIAILAIIGGVTCTVTRWAIREYQTYHPAGNPVP